MDLIKKLTGYAGKRILFLCLFIMTAGLSSGIFFAFMLPETDMTYLTGLLQDALASDSLKVFRFMICNLLILCLIVLSGISVFGTPLAFLLFFCRAMFFGVCIPLVTSAPAKDLIPFMLSNMVLLSVFLAATVLCTGYGLSQLNIRT